MKAIQIGEIKKAMLAYRDIYGGDIMYTDLIENAKSKKELAEIIEMYKGHLADCAIDAQNHLDNFRRKIGLNNL